MLQGPNNTSITLGSSNPDTRDFEELLDLDYSLNKEAVSRGFFDPDGMSGAIDIVVGRSNNLMYIPEEKGSEFCVKGKSGEPLTVRNSDGFLEVKKNPTFLDIPNPDITHPRLYNINEGDPNILHDASRIYLGREEDVDEIFGIPDFFANNMFHSNVDSEILNGSDSGGSSDTFKSIESYTSVFPIAKDSQGSCIAARSKNIRIVAKSYDDKSRSIMIQDSPEAEPKSLFIPGEQGSIIILKEGRLIDEGPLNVSDHKGVPIPGEPDALNLPYAAEFKFGTQGQQIDDENPAYVPEHASEDGNGRAVIALGADGTIYIDGPRIVIGSGNEKDNGEGTQISLGIDSHEPIVMGNQLHGILSAIINVLDNHVHPTGTGPSGKRIPGGSEVPMGGFKNTVEDIDDLKKMLSKIGKTK